MSKAPGLILFMWQVSIFEEGDNIEISDSFFVSLKQAFQNHVANLQKKVEQLQSEIVRAPLLVEFASLVQLFKQGYT